MEQLHLMLGFAYQAAMHALEWLDPNLQVLGCETRLTAWAGKHLDSHDFTIR